MSFELHGHTYSDSIGHRYKQGLAWVCVVENCKRIHTSKHEKCGKCREVICRRCKKRKTLDASKLCSYCKSLRGRE